MSTDYKGLLNPTLMDVLETFRLDKTYIKGQGSYLVDESGTSYLDFIAQYGAVPFGYNPEFIWNKLMEVKMRGLPSLCQPSLPGEALSLARMLAEVTPGDLRYCTFCQSGTEAVEAAIKLARSTTGRELIISTDNSFHGKTLGSLSATGKDSYQEPFRAPAPGFLRVPYNDTDELRRVLEAEQGNVAAFIVEPVQGEGGIIVAEPGYLVDVQNLCKEYGIVLIVDEIQTGLGRTGSLFACDHEGIEPDIMLLAKAIGGGLLPLGVCISSPRVWNDDFGMLHSSTFANNNVTCAVGIAVLEKLLENDLQLIQEVDYKGQYLLAKLQELARKYPQVIKEARGKGLMAGLEFHSLSDCGSYDLSYMVQQGAFSALLAGFLLNVCHIRVAPYLNNSMTLRLEPSLTITVDEIDRVIESIEFICRVMHCQDYALLYRYLIGDYERPEIVADCRHYTRLIKHSSLKPGEEASKKFAFIIHYPAPEDVLLNNPSFVSYTRDELYRLMEWESRISEPGIVCHMPGIRSADGTLAEGWLIGVPFGAREIMNLPRETPVEIIKKAVDLGRDLGAGIVGLGALTSVVTRGGRVVQDRGVAITSGNSFTTLMAVEAMALGAQKMHIDLETGRGAVLGATGSIGRACAMMLSDYISHIILLGNPLHAKSSHNRLLSLVKEILDRACCRREQGMVGGLSTWLDRVYQLLKKKNSPVSQEFINMLDKGENLELNTLEAISSYLGINCPLKISLDVETALPSCNMIVAASNSPEYIIYPHHLSAGAVVCDVARPADVAPETMTKRDDVLILEGGLVQLPDQVAFGPNLGYRDGVSLACLSETILLALEGDYRDYSIGMRLDLDTVEYLRELGKKHGFSLAGLKMGNREISDSEIELIYQNSRQNLRQAQNL